MLIYIVATISQDSFNKIKKIYKAFSTKEKAQTYLDSLNKTDTYEWFIIKEVEFIN